MDLTLIQIADSGSEAAIRDLIISRRLQAMEGDVASATFMRTVNRSFFDVLDTVREALGPWNVEVKSYASTEAILTLSDASTFFVLYAGHRHGQSNPWEVCSRPVILDGHGDRKLLKTVFDRLEILLPESKYASLTWEFMSPQGRQNRSLHLGIAKELHTEFFPFLAPDAREFQKRYLASDSAVLILLGPPGTGKTSFIRDMVHTHSLKTTFTYDEQLLDSDSLFVDFISGDQDLLVVEDADMFLTDRERGGNQKMARFLNVSDGLAAPAHPKKIIFTANITNKNQIDAALLRPGRCFGCQMFRKLTFSEATVAANAAGLPPCLVEDRGYTLAEIFALGRGEALVPEAQKMGVR